MGRGTRAAVRWSAGVWLALAMLASAAFAGAEDWNDQAIKWRPYAEGLAEAKQAKKPICLVFYTTWCPHCANYSRVFQDPAVVQKATEFVMIRIDNDKQKDISEKYRPDGDYIPRTFFLSSNGKLDPTLAESRAQYKYFYDERGPAGILAGMDRALAKLR